MRQDEFVGRARAYVQCKDCSCVGKIWMEGWTMGFEDHPAKYRSLEDAKRNAVANWNRRFKRHSNSLKKEVFREVMA